MTDELLPALRAALEGRFRAHHAVLVSHLLAQIEYLDETIAQLTAEIEERLRPYERQRELLCTIPGVAERTAEVIVAELGPDVERNQERVTQRLVRQLERLGQRVTLEPVAETAR